MLTKLFEIELTVCIKMDLTLNNLQKLICHKTQPTNQNWSNIEFRSYYGKKIFRNICTPSCESIYTERDFPFKGISLEINVLSTTLVGNGHGVPSSNPR